MKLQITAALLLAVLAGYCMDVSAEPGITAHDKQFILDTAQAGATEVELGRIALKNTGRADVREFAEQMIADHTKAGEALKKIADEKHVIIPSALDSDKQKVVKSLKVLVGKDFDRAYSLQMVADHKQATASIQAQITMPDPDLKNWSMETLPTIKHHLEMAHTMKSKVMNSNDVPRDPVVY